MKIAHICAYSWEIGGPPKVIYDHTEVALAEGHQVDILSPYSEGETPYPVPEGGRLLRFKRTAPISRVFREFSWPLFSYLRAHLREYDVVHCHGLWHWGALAPFMIDSPGVVKVVTVHGVLDRWAYAQSRWKKQLVDTLAQKRFLQQADLIHVITEEEREDVNHYLGTTHPNIVLIPNGVKVRDFAEMPAKDTFRHEFNIKKEQKIVLFMSRLNAKKGLDLLLPAFRQYAQQNDDAVLVLAGPDDGYAQTARQFISQYGLDDRIRMVGMIKGDLKKAALADATLFTLPSYSEGFSMACLEAMAAGTPSLLSDRVGFGESIRAYDAAQLIELTPEGVLSGLQVLLSDESRRDTVRQNARRLVTEKYDIDRLSRQLLNEYAALCAR
ncbi:glycosyltransferase [Rudanella paleaurantiibacter]|uniref:Glycosyltransferase n=1 Tax=Rudanella paleaurantiibacter TaxID=2614655 RepID=A0A7J5TYE0_9BACT|nr:glycosyltransferase [Rudanella paleaurantiibacter]KAB7730158.1 glycosyltransferase [Rudanella paleaurantiibacter]